LEQRGHEKWYDKLFRILNSAICFSSAYLLINYLHWVVVALAGKLFKFDGFIYYHGVKFILNGHRWDKLNVFIIYTAGPLFALIFGLLSIYLYSKFKRIKNIINIFFLWSFIIGVSIFLSQSVIASIGLNEYLSPYYTDFAIAFAWARIPRLLVYAINLPFAVMLLYFAVNSARPFMVFAYSYTKVNKLQRRRKYFFEVAILPFIIGSIITTIAIFPVSSTSYSLNIFVHATYLLIIAIIMFIAWYALQYIEVMKDEVIKYKNLQSLSSFGVFFFIILVIFIRLTWHGIYI
jgi:hypothetical protein